MNQTLTYIILCITVVMICGIGLFVFYYKWESAIKKILQTMRDTKTELEQEEAFALESTAAEKLLREPLTWARVKRQLAMPVLYSLLFPVLYQFPCWFFTEAKQDWDMGSMILCGLVIGVLLVLVLAMFGSQEKRPRRKFWLELIPTLVLEFMLVFDVYFLLSGYYAERGLRGAKSFLLFLAVGIPWFLSYAAKTQRNWARLLATEKSEDFD